MNEGRLVQCSPRLTVQGPDTTTNEKQNHKKMKEKINNGLVKSRLRGTRYLFKQNFTA